MLVAEGTTSHVLSVLVSRLLDIYSYYRTTLLMKVFNNHKHGKKTYVAQVHIPPHILTFLHKKLGDSGIDTYSKALLYYLKLGIQAELLAMMRRLDEDY